MDVAIFALEEGCERLSAHAGDAAVVEILKHCLAAEVGMADPERCLDCQEGRYLIRAFRTFSTTTLRFCALRSSCPGSCM